MMFIGKAFQTPVRHLFATGTASGCLCVLDSRRAGLCRRRAILREFLFQFVRVERSLLRKSFQRRHHARRQLPPTSYCAVSLDEARLEPATDCFLVDVHLVGDLPRTQFPVLPGGHIRNITSLPE